MCRFYCTVDSHLRYSHCKLQLSPLLFSSIFWLFVVWLICILKQHLLIKNYWLGHVNRSSPDTSTLQSKTCIGCMESEQNQNRRFHSTQGSWKLFFKTTMIFSWCTLHPVRGNFHATVLSTIIGTDLVCTLTNKNVLISATFFYYFYCPVCCFNSQVYKPWKILQVGLYLATALTWAEMTESDRKVSCTAVTRSWDCLYPLH